MAISKTIDEAQSEWYSLIAEVQKGVEIEIRDGDHLIAILKPVMENSPPSQSKLTSVLKKHAFRIEGFRFDREEAHDR